MRRWGYFRNSQKGRLRMAQGEWIGYSTRSIGFKPFNPIFPEIGRNRTGFARNSIENFSKISNKSSERSDVTNADLIDDFEAHLAGRAGDDAEGGFVVARV